MPIIANTTSANTFSAVRAQLNSVTKRINQFAVNESAIYANTITANVSIRISGTFLANNSAGTPGYYLRSSGTGVYWSPVPAQTQYLQVANAVATYQTKTIERAALANTNAYIATKLNITTFNLALANTNAYIASVAASSGSSLKKSFNIVGAFSAPVTGASRYVPTSNATITNVQLVNSGIVNSDLTVRLNKNGSSLSTFTIASGDYISNYNGLNYSITTSDYLTVDVVSGSGTNFSLTISN